MNTPQEVRRPAQKCGVAAYVDTFEHPVGTIETAALDEWPVGLELNGVE